MGLKTLMFILLLFQYLVQDTTSKIVQNEDWHKPQCCENCPALNDIVHDSISERYVKICQLGESGTQSHFGTLFDTKNRIPVFSKFTVQSGSNQRACQRKFLYEAQLVDEGHFDGNIAGKPEIARQLDLGNQEAWERIKTRQAIECDYSQSGYVRGHLRPCAGSEDSRATCTYTNVVPQVSDFNNGLWKSVEYRTRNFIKDAKCSDHHVIVGAVPGKARINDRVAIPSALWSYVRCDHHIVVFLAGNINKKLINKHRLLTVFFAKYDDVRNVLRAMRDLAGESNRLCDIKHMMKRFGKDMRKYAKKPPMGLSEKVLKNLACKETSNVKSCGIRQYKTKWGIQKRKRGGSQRRIRKPKV